MSPALGFPCPFHIKLPAIVRLQCEVNVAVRLQCKVDVAAGNNLWQFIATPFSLFLQRGHFTSSLPSGSQIKDINSKVTVHFMCYIHNVSCIVQDLKIH